MYWYDLAKQAASIYSHRTSFYVNISSMLNRVPAIPEISGHTTTCHVSRTKKAMFFSASSSWKVDDNTEGCGINGKQRTAQADLRIGI